MKFVRNALVAAALGGALIGATATTASAGPIRSKNALPVQAFCPSGTVLVVVNGNAAPFAAAHVVGDHSVFIPTALDLDITQDSQTQHFEASKPNPAPQPTETCDVASSFVPGLVIEGTVTGYFTPVT